MTSDRPWLPDDPDIEVTCGGCNRGITLHFYESEFPLDAHIYNHTEDGLVQKWTFCGDCRDEIEPFAEEVLDPTDDARSETQCGFCNNEITDDLYEVAYTPTFMEDWTGAALCDNCEQVVQDFLAGVPEESVDGPDPEGDVYYPAVLSESPVQAHKDDIDYSAILSSFDNFETGDMVYFEAHRPQHGNEPAQYFCGTGRITEWSVGGGGTRVTLDPIEDYEGFWFGNEPSEYVLEPQMLMHSDEDYLRLLVEDDNPGWDKRTYEGFSGTVTVIKEAEK